MFVGAVVAHCSALVLASFAQTQIPVIRTRGGHSQPRSRTRIKLGRVDVVALPGPAARRNSKLYHAAHRVDSNFPSTVEDLGMSIFRCSYPCTEHPARRAF